jgi:hypothetical protein
MCAIKNKKKWLLWCQRCMVRVSAQVGFKNWCPACAAFCCLCRVLPHFVCVLTDARLFARRVNEVAVEVVAAAVAAVVVEVVVVVGGARDDGGDGVGHIPAAQSTLTRRM